MTYYEAHDVEITAEMRPPRESGEEGGAEMRDVQPSFFAAPISRRRHEPPTTPCALREH